MRGRRISRRAQEYADVIVGIDKWRCSLLHCRGSTVCQPLVTCCSTAHRFVADQHYYCQRRLFCLSGDCRIRAGDNIVTDDRFYTRLLQESTQLFRRRDSTSEYAIPRPRGGWSDCPPRTVIGMGKGCVYSWQYAHMPEADEESSALCEYAGGYWFARAMNCWPLPANSGNELLLECSGIAPSDAQCAICSRNFP